MDKPQNPETLDAVGLARLATLSDAYMIYPVNPIAPWRGEPLALPAAMYVDQLSPRGDMMMGWELTAAGIAAWTSAASSATGAVGA